MKALPSSFALPSLAVFAACCGATVAHAQTAYGVDSAGDLFTVNLSAPGAGTSFIGNLGFVPAAIDFRPGTSTLYAFGVSGSTATIYTVNTATGAATAIGAGFSTSGTVGSSDYDISGATSFAFDFNPTTLQVDESIRIRLVGNDGSNLRLHSATGGIAAVDGSINGVGDALLSGAAYINSDVATMGGATALYYIDYANDGLVLSVPPNAGTLNPVGTGLGVDVGADLGFDIYSGASTDIGYFVNTTGAGAADLYAVDLATGGATLVGGVARDFTGGFSIDQTSAIPEPSSFAALAGLMGLGFAATRRRGSRAA